MTIRVAINGFGRIGRNILRAKYENSTYEDIQIVAINDLGDSSINAHLLVHDTVHGKFNTPVDVNGDKIDSIIDLKSKNKINPKDVQRSIRAYEVKLFTKKSLHDWFKKTKSYFKEDEFFKIYIDYPRKDLIRRIEKRTEQMIKMGAIKEVKRFIKRHKLTKNMQGRLLRQVFISNKPCM